MGRYSDEANRILGISTSSRSSSPASLGVLREQGDLSRAVRRATSAVAASPGLNRRYADEARRILSIFKGDMPSLKGGALAGLSRGVLGGLKTATDVIGTPLRFVTSAAKEVIDLSEGKGASVKDLVSQTLDTSFYPSTIIPKTGNKWADAIIGFGADVALDPLTYVGFGALNAAGRSGRIALAGKYAETATLFGKKAAKEKLDDIVRLGEWALDDVEREMLNLPKGLRYQFGGGGLIAKEGTTAGKISGKVAEVGGKNVARVRALIGDIPGLAKAQAYVRPKSYGGTLNQLGRGANLDGINVLQEVARYSANVYGRAQNNLTRQTILGANREVIDALANSPYAATVYQVMDGSAQASGRVIPEAEQALADALTSLQNQARDLVNTEVIDPFNLKRGVNAYRVGYQEDYGFARSLTPEAQNYVRDRRFGSRQFDSQIAEGIDVSPAEFITGTPAMRARKLSPTYRADGTIEPQTWLGRVLNKAEDFTVDNLNKISQEELGFNWFNTDARVFIDDYVDSLSRQAARVAFVDRLFDYGTDVVDGLMPKLVADPELVRAGRRMTNTWRKFQQKAAKIIDNIEAGAAARLGVVEGLEQEARSLRSQLVSARKVAATKDAEVRESFEQVLGPLEIRLAELDRIIASSNSDEQAAISLLRSLHVRAFPDVDDAARPTSLGGLARELRSGARERYRQTSAELAERAKAGEDVARQMASTKGALTRRERQIADIQARGVTARQQRAGLPKERQQVQAKITRAKKDLDVAIKDDPAIKAAKSLEQKYTQVVNRLNQQRLLLANVQNWQSEVKPVLEEAIESVRGLSSARVVVTEGGARETPLNAIKDINGAWYENTQAAFDQLATARGLTRGQRDAGERVLKQLKAAEVDLIESEVYINYWDSVTRAMDSNPSEFGANMVNQIKVGWTAIEGLGVQIPTDMKNLLFARLDELTAVQNVRQFVKIFDRYAQFFRVSAMFTPGFIVRNAMTAAFNNFVYGTTPQDIADAIRFTRAVYKDGPQAALDALPAGVRAEYETAYRGVLASGGGQAMDIVTQPITPGAATSRIVDKVLQSKAGRWWADGNIATEMAARMGMALRSVRRGNNLEQTASIVSLFHFDYTDLSKLDEIAKTFVPFWTFASRNIPLQMMMQVSRPSMYRAYESLQRNAGVDTEQMVLPGYLARRGPIQVPGLPDWILNPDLPQLDMEEQVSMFVDPARLLSQLYPQYRLLPELAGGRKLGIDVPFSETPQQVRGPLDLPAYLAALFFGGATTTAEGPAFSEKAAYALPNLFPTLGTAQRLIPQLGGPRRAEERQLSSIATTLGLPLRQVPAAEQERELQRRQYALRDYLADLRRRGFIE